MAELAIKAGETVLLPVASGLLVSGVLVADMALASSSTSSNTSCLIALMEYAHIAMAKAPNVSPIIAFLRR
jgi:hypothetical protein